MSRYLMILEIEDVFYQEYSEQGTTRDELLEQLKLDIQDQLDEYDFRRLITQMISPKNQEDTIVFAPKKLFEENVLSQFLIVCHDC